MYIYYCDKCRSFESFVGADEEWKCKECGSDLLALGVTIDEWNAMTNDQMLDTIDFAKAEYDKKNEKYNYSAVMDEPQQPKPDVRVDLMECPECFKSISPKSTKCPHCGHFFVNNPKAVRRRKAKRKLSLKIILMGLLPLLLGGVYEGIILSGSVLTGELTLLYATDSPFLYVVEYGGFVFVAIGLIMILFGIIGFAKNKPYIAEKIKDDDWQDGVIESSIVTHDKDEDVSEKEVIKPDMKRHVEEKPVGDSSEEVVEDSTETVEADEVAEVEEVAEAEEAAETVETEETAEAEEAPEVAETSESEETLETEDVPETEISSENEDAPETEVAEESAEAEEIEETVETAEITETEEVEEDEEKTEND